MSTRTYETVNRFVSEQRRTSPFASPRASDHGGNNAGEDRKTHIKMQDERELHQCALLLACVPRCVLSCGVVVVPVPLLQLYCVHPLWTPSWCSM